MHVGDPLEHSAHNVGSGALRVVALLDDSIEELPPTAVLHDYVYGVLVLVHVFELHHVGAVPEMLHYHHLPPDVVELLHVPHLSLHASNTSAATGHVGGAGCAKRELAEASPLSWSYRRRLRQSHDR